MTTKLKNMKLTSVDLVRAGANQEAFIRMFKSDGQGAEPGPEEQEALSAYSRALLRSVRSIREDKSLDEEARRVRLQESWEQYCAVLAETLGFAFEREEETEEMPEPAEKEPEDRYDEIETAQDEEGAAEAGYPPFTSGERYDRIQEVEKYNHNHDEQGRFSSADGGGSGSSASAGKTKYAPSARRNGKGITVSKKKYAALCGTLMTQHPGLRAGERATIRDGGRKYYVEADGFGGMTILSIKKLR